MEKSLNTTIQLIEKIRILMLCRWPGNLEKRGTVKGKEEEAIYKEMIVIGPTSKSQELLDMEE